MCSQGFEQGTTVLQIRLLLRGADLKPKHPDYKTVPLTTRPRYRPASTCDTGQQFLHSIILCPYKAKKAKLLDKIPHKTLIKCRRNVFYSEGSNLHHDCIGPQSNFLTSLHAVSMQPYGTFLNGRLTNFPLLK